MPKPVISTFWSILIMVGAAALVILLIAKITGDRPSPVFMGFALLLLEIAMGFDCVVEAIRRED